MKDLLDGLRQLSQIERTRKLESYADEIRTGTYYREFHEEEIQDLKDLNLQNDLEIRALEQKKDELLAPINAKLKELKNTKKHTLANLVEGRENVSGDYYVIDDDVTMKTYHISPLGDVIWTGPIQSKQKTIYQANRKTA